MKLREIKELLEADVLCGEEGLDDEAGSAFASDFMSDLLAFAGDQKVLLTGMINPQVVRSAEMVDMKCIVFVRGKVPGEDVLGLARECGMVVLASKMLMYTACGVLYSNGLRSDKCPTSF